MLTVRLTAIVPKFNIDLSKNQKSNKMILLTKTMYNKSENHIIICVRTIKFYQKVLVSNDKY